MPEEHESLEIDTSALMEEFYPEPQQTLKIEVADASDALVSSMNALMERMVSTEERQGEIIQALMDLTEHMKSDREALTAALQIEPVINVTVPETVVNVPETVVNVHVPETVVNVSPAPAPEVNVHLPSSRRTVKVERDPLTGLISSANVEEVEGGG